LQFTIFNKEEFKIGGKKPDVAEKYRQQCLLEWYYEEDLYNDTR